MSAEFLISKTLSSGIKIVKKTNLHRDENGMTENRENDHYGRFLK